MEAALRKAFEETTNTNLRGVIDYVKATRDMTREMQEAVKGFERTLVMYKNEVDQLRKQVAILQAKSVLQGSE